MWIRALGIALLAITLAGPVLADDDDDEDRNADHNQDALRGGEFSVHLGVFEPRGHSDYWDETEQFTTQDITDFDDFIGGVGFATHVNPYFDVGFQAEYYRGQTNVRYKNIFTPGGRGLRQDHTLRMIPVDVSFKFLPLPREVARGRHGQVISRPVVPYIGGGIGAVPWDYVEQGKFVDDLVNPTISFNDKREARGIAPSAHAFVGVEVQFTEQFAMYFEGRYRWAKDDLGNDFVTDNDRFDLSGGQLVAGMTFRF